MEGCTLNGVIRPGETKRDLTQSRVVSTHLQVRRTPFPRPSSNRALALNLHKRIDEEVCRIAWVNEASTDTCAFDLSLSDTKSHNKVTNGLIRSQPIPRHRLLPVRTPSGCQTDANCCRVGRITPSPWRSRWKDELRVECDDGLKIRRASGECLGAVCRGRTCQATIRGRELQASFDLPISEWGNPAGVMTSHPKGRARGELKHLSTLRKRKQT